MHYEANEETGGDSVVETAKKAMDFTMLVEAFVRDDCDCVRKPSESELAEAMYSLRAHIAEVYGQAVE